MTRRHEMSGRRHGLACFGPLQREAAVPAPCSISSGASSASLVSPHAIRDVVAAVLAFEARVPR